MQNWKPSIWAALLVTLSFTPSALAQPSPFDTAMRAAMTPYYAALLASAREDTEGTLRHLVVLKARWDALRRAASAGPAWARGTGPDNPITAGTQAIETARQRATSRNVGAAHLALESIRITLSETRTQHNARTFDDAVTDFHEAVERLVARAGEAYEIRLKPEDFPELASTAEKAGLLWEGADKAATPSDRTAEFVEISKRMGAILEALQSSARARKGDEVQSNAQALKTAYYDMLAMLSRRK